MAVVTQVLLQQITPKLHFTLVSLHLLSFVFYMSVLSQVCAQTYPNFLIKIMGIVARRREYEVATWFPQLPQPAGKQWWRRDKGDRKQTATSGASHFTAASRDRHRQKIHSSLFFGLHLSHGFVSTGHLLWRERYGVLRSCFCGPEARRKMRSHSTLHPPDLPCLQSAGHRFLSAGKISCFGFLTNSGCGCFASFLPLYLSLALICHVIKTTIARGAA